MDSLNKGRLFALALALAPMAAAAQTNEPQPGTPAENQDFKVEVEPPKAGSLRAQALAALEQTETLTLYSLEPWQAPRVPTAWHKLPEAKRSGRIDALFEKDRRRWCRGYACIDANRVLGRVETSGADRLVVLQAARESLGKVPNFGYACGAVYRHALAFADQAHRYEVLLCYHCGQVKVVVDGKQDSGDGQAYEMSDLRAINAILTRAGVPLSKDADAKGEDE
ncbi:hypothetical protein RDV84_10575 [Lysobacter yananisis]|uniref:Uncharacterized protein n=1 Tax=Lysobacter yananisis TaxID=1003114 RepID=A0ABY9PHD9_9GAMM|nr:hypothetical protein [Lysobacter yananisis]WMT05262.1 hypothetical protein RDV84_10575 [Lysobacter yananisis]